MEDKVKEKLERLDRIIKQGLETIEITHRNVNLTEEQKTEGKELANQLYEDKIIKPLMELVLVNFDVLTEISNKYGSQFGYAVLISNFILIIERLTKTKEVRRDVLKMLQEDIDIKGE